jgi:GNAT superfamily N-acetyltransferase
LDGKETEFRATPENVETMLFSASPAGEAWLAVQEDHAVGVVVFSPFSPILFASDGCGSLYLTKIFVEDAYRGKGVGQALIRHCQTLAKERNLARVVWGVNPGDRLCANLRSHNGGKSGLGSTGKSEMVLSNDTVRTRRQAGSTPKSPIRVSTTASVALSQVSGCACT